MTPATGTADRPATADVRAGMDWWNELTAPARGEYLTRSMHAGYDGSPAGAWEYFKGMTTVNHIRPESVRESAVLREAATGERKVLEENPRNVAVTVCTGLEIKMLAAMGRDFETSGDAPVLDWYRDADGTIRGVILLGRVS